MQYPKWIYHKEKALVVESREEQDSYGPEWKETPFVEEVKPTEEKQTEASEKSAAIPKEDYKKLNKSELVEICHELGIDSKGLSKSEIIEKLEAL